MDITGRNFKCPDVNCTDLRVRFGEPESGIYLKAKWINETNVRVKIPKYTKPDVLRVELTLNDQDYTNDRKTYGYFDPYVLNAEPRLIHVNGTTKVRIKGFGFVQSNETKSQISNRTCPIYCRDAKDCIKDAAFIDKETLETDTFPQRDVNYRESLRNVEFDPMYIDASVYGNSFTENTVELFYYDEPEYKGPS